MIEYGRTIFKSKIGSHLYGLQRPESDLDYMSVFIPKSEYLLGLKRIEEVDNSTKSSAAGTRNTADDIDDKNYTLPKYLHLALQNNPNIVEVLFATPENILVQSPEWRELVENRDKILSQRVFLTFTGYAFSQKKKLTVKSERFKSLCKGILLIEDSFSKEEIEGYTLSVGIADMLNKELKYYKGDKQNCESFHEGMSLKMIYEKLISERDTYGWRVHTDTFETLGYDCYREDTEFLTDSGWKHYGEINSLDKLATINPKNLSLEFQDFYDRKILPYSGEMYQIENMFTKCVITPSHKMLVSQCHRGSVGYKYSEDKASWEFKTVEDLDNGPLSYFHILNSIKNNNIDYNISDSYLKLSGAYLSEGVMVLRDDKVKCARIGQTTRGKQSFFKMMNDISKDIQLRVYKNSRIGTTKNHLNIDYTWWYTNKETAEKLFKDFYRLSATKAMPPWVLKLSKRQALVLLDSLILGDGTERKFCYCYTTISKELASGVQALALLAEKNTNLKHFSYIRKNGKLDDRYHVYISKSDAKPRATYFNTSTTRNFETKKSERGVAGGHKTHYEGNVCCFTTPNSTLITRLDGKIAVQGNCKFGYHLIRILAEGYELLTTGKLSYPIMGEARDDIVKVREGKVELPELLEMYDKYDALCKDADKNTVLPKKPDFNWADAWLISILKKSIIDE
jgi:hypothetical protein